ncbi:hypothetical protein [Phytohabitans aurantiacus]|jgi:hypothetical protein|uniref:hypothetical protein n=1 Tax=Phytohabitans aurantiacus TaxID=3016789 RepID=UPI002490CB60|nr:hypothetical protein [Phytohabitans aurantiacus]
MPNSNRGWSTSVLRTVETVFALMSADPTHLVLSGDVFGPELPAGRVAVRDLRSLLLAPQVSLATRDAVWRELIVRARRDRASQDRAGWRVAAVWLAAPGLRRWTYALAQGFRGDVEDLESQIVEGFLRELDRVDVTDTSLAYRLVRAGHKAGTRLVYAEAAFDGARWAAYRSQTPPEPWGHPDLVLLDAVAADVITLDEAKLIATTRLDGVPIDRVALLAGERTNTVVVRRHRAEHRLAEAIADGWVSNKILTAVLVANGAGV